MRALRFLPQLCQIYDGLCRAMRFCHAALVINTATDAQLHETALLSSFCLRQLCFHDRKVVLHNF